jgi:alpha-beta hydrolase superfamily lysophospholipase
MNQIDIMSATGLCKLYVRVWEPEGRPKAVLQVVHGMAEHIDRYDDFAGFFARNGILVVGADIASHGKSRESGGAKGYFGEKDGWSALVEDIHTLYRSIKQIYNDVPYFLFGHSMGSFLARTYAARCGEDMDGFIFCGTGGSNPAVPLGRLIAKAEIKIKGATAQSKALSDFLFGTYNKAFRPNRTKFDWLSVNEANVDGYVADEECGYAFTAGGFRDMFDGLTEIGAKDWAKKVPMKPILLIAGILDPVGAMGKGPREVEKALTSTGHDVKLILYEGMRHEIHNENGKEQVYQDILSFLEAHI